mmetsp:Transcript_12500/g.19863  ORF Transcript_12500/g.19863 Transcript_12500/m.19863 type:complete len:88 (-) Transcript_12500:291-554(-)
MQTLTRDQTMNRAARTSKQESWESMVGDSKPQLQRMVSVFVKIWLTIFVSSIQCCGLKLGMLVFQVAISTLATVALGTFSSSSDPPT